MGRKQDSGAEKPATDRITVDKKTDEAILRLGRRLVGELGAERTTDTLARWMAHDIAGLLHQADHASGTEAQVARIACRDAIIALWQHRAGAPGRLSRMGSLEGWSRLLREHNTPLLQVLTKKPDGAEGEGVSEADVCFALVTPLQSMADPLVRAALHIAAQTADPAVKEETQLAALAKLEDEESKLTRILIRWSDNRLPRKEEMRAEIKKAVVNFNASAEAILRALESLPVNEAVSDYEA